MLIVFFILFLILGLRLFIIVAFQGEELTTLASNNTIKTMLTDAPRGEIYDRNGVLLAGNKTEFSINLSRNDMTQDEINETVINLVGILNKNEETVLDDFPIQINENGEYYFTFDQQLANWKAGAEIPENYTAEQAFNEVRRRYAIPEDMDRYEAQQKLISEYNVSVPISVATMEYRQNMDKRQFLETFRISAKQQESGVSAKKAYRIIRDEMELRFEPEGFGKTGKYLGISLGWMKDGFDLNDKEVSQILAMRYLLIKQGFMRYLPAEVAFGIKAETVLEIEENLHNLQGVSVLKSYIRYYPEGDAASHTIGYIGKIPDEQLKTPEFQEKVANLEYRTSDLIGQYGAEGGFEDLLKGSYGTKKVQVDRNGIVLQTIGEEVKAKKGEDIALTIDIELQRKVKASLLQGIEAARYGGAFYSRFGTYINSKAAYNADIGAAVVIDVKTGEPLAIANSDDFDPNMFARGITADDWNSLQTDNPRDPLSRRPLYNVATSTAVQPGSTFKPLTAIVGLEHGLDPYRLLYDRGFYEIGDHIYSCMAWNTFNESTHGSVDLFEGMRVSCNFYFFDVASGRDLAAGTDLGYADQVTIDVITDYAKQFGLGVRSDIEIEERIVPAPTEEGKITNIENLLKNYLYGECEYIFTAEALTDKKQMMLDINTIVSWTKENPERKDLTQRLLDLGIKEDEATALAMNIKSTYYNYATWTLGDELNVAIGQGETAFTPLQMANYMATIGNGGTLNSSSILKAKESVGEVQRPEGTPTNIQNPETLGFVREAMRRVVTGGTLQRGFEGLPISSVGKTGTAQRDGYINPPSEVDYIRDNLYIINPSLNWEDVETEMHRLLEEFDMIYTNPDTAVRKAVLNLSGRYFNRERLDEGIKGKYDDFGWVVALAPAGDPEIAVAVMLVQSGGSEAVSPIVREIIGDYFDLKSAREEAEFAVDYVTIFDKRLQAEAEAAALEAAAATQADEQEGTSED